LDDVAKPKDEKPETPSEETVKDETVDEPQPEPKVEPVEEAEDTNVEEIKDESAEDHDTEEAEKSSEEIVDDKPERESTEPEIKEDKPDKEPEKPTKVEAKKEKPRKDRGPDFKYIVRLSNTDVDGEKNVVYGLTSIKGIGVHMATLIADETGISRNAKVGDLSDAQIEKLQTIIDAVTKTAPSWMLNHRKDYETGDDIHLIGSEIDMRLRDEINIMKKIRSYRGIRHERGLPVRGQRTRANNRKGLALGVSKKREPGSK
jgi:small subunit ribosomal protein S13